MSRAKFGTEEWIEQKTIQHLIRDAEYTTRQAHSKEQIRESWTALKLQCRESWWRLRHPIRALRTWWLHKPPPHTHLHLLWQDDQIHSP